MSSLATSSPVSASTFEYLMRWPVFLLIWLKETFSVSEVAGYSATGQVTSDSRRKPFQLARGAMTKTPKRNPRTKPMDTTREPDHKATGLHILPTALTAIRFALHSAKHIGVRPKGRGRRGTSPNMRRYLRGPYLPSPSAARARGTLRDSQRTRSPWPQPENMIA